MTHAQCWAHSRRKLIEAQDIEPISAAQALDWIGALYAIETQIRDEGLAGNAKCAHRQEQAKPIVDRFFTWIDQQFDRQGFLPSSPFLGALAYIRERRAGLSVYLDDPDVAIDTNHLERALRVIPMGRRKWLFAWTELGAKHVGIVQSLLVTCRLHDINPYDYFVDVLQRLGQHPASLVHELTLRIWADRAVFDCKSLQLAPHDYSLMAEDWFVTAQKNIATRVTSRLMLRWPKPVWGRPEARRCRIFEVIASETCSGPPCRPAYTETIVESVRLQPRWPRQGAIIIVELVNLITTQGSVPSCNSSKPKYAAG